MIAVVRALRLVIHLMVGLLLAAVISADFTRRISRERAMHWWCVMLLEMLNIQLRVRGGPLGGARFTVANHVSWLDIPLIGACEPTRFVSKSEVKDWPVAGWLADAAGTFYIRRGKGGAAPLIERLVPHLRSGGSVMIFPEGTTTDGGRVLDFYSRTFAAAIEAQCPVQPVAIRYGLSANGENFAPFIGDDDLVSHILRVVREPETTAEITYCKPIAACGRERDALAALAHAAVCAAVERPAAALAPEPECEPLAA